MRRREEEGRERERERESREHVVCSKGTHRSYTLALMLDNTSTVNHKQFMLANLHKLIARDSPVVSYMLPHPFTQVTYCNGHALLFTVFFGLSVCIHL